MVAYSKKFKCKSLIITINEGLLTTLILLYNEAHPVNDTRRVKLK